MLVVVYVLLTEVLMLSILVRRVCMRDGRVIVLVLVGGGQVLPLAHELVHAFTPVVRYVRMLVFVNNRVVVMLDELLDMASLTRLAAELTERADLAEQAASDCCDAAN